MAGLGKDVASVLWESWKPAPPVFSGTADTVAAVAPTLLATGAASLAWWKLRTFESLPPDLADEIRNGFRMHALQASLHERTIRTVLPALRDAGVEPLLVKGWAAARNYPEAALRPYGDIDLCVSDVAAATAVLGADAMQGFNVDLHEGGEHLIDVPFEAVMRASRLLDLDGTPVRVPSDEHHLRILCLHLLYHGAWRPLWLCDVGAALDAVDDDFDWTSFLGTDAVRAGWMAATLRLAESLLGADLSRAPESIRTVSIPGWLERTVLREWTRSHRWTTGGTLGDAIARRPWAVPLEVVRRWPDPLRASVACGASFDHGWRAAYQFRYGLSRLGTVLRQIFQSGRSPSTPSVTIGN